MDRGPQETRLFLLSGGHFDFHHPIRSIYTIDDVALGLSRHYRFAGHTRYPLTVAQHCVVLSKMVTPEFALAALMHDASEAFLGDIVRSAKIFLKEYQAVETTIMRDVFERVGLCWDEMPESIKKMDTELGDLESLLCMGRSGDFPDGWDEVGLNMFWDEDCARSAFLKRWGELTCYGPNHILTDFKRP